MRWKTALRRAGVVLFLLPLAACSDWFGSGEETFVSTAPSGERTVVVRSTRPRLFGQVLRRAPGDVGEARRDTLTERALTAAEGPPEVVSAVRIPPAREGAAVSRAVRLDTATVLQPGAPLDFGEVATVCGLAPSQLGKLVDESAAGYRLHDTMPGSVAPRTQYVTGFGDGCARQFTATEAELGSVAGHEVTRYNPLNENPWTESDRLYEAVKAEVCGVERGVPCPEDRRAALEDRAAFVSVYHGFGPDGRWLQMFLHDGALVTAAAE